MSHSLAPFQLLELNVISAQDLAPVGRSMRTYAVAWVHPDRKLSTRVDTQGHANPTWNDKFVFRVDEEFLHADTSAIMIEIFALHWFKDIHVGTVRVLVGNLIPPPTRPFHNNHAPMGMRFVALQVRRASGRPQGILNIGVAVLDSSMRSMPLYTLNSSAVGYRHLMGEKDAYENHNHIMSPQVFAVPKPELRRTKSDTSSMIGSEAMARQQRAIANNGRASSAISGSEVSSIKSNNSKKKNKKKGKKGSRGSSSILSGGSDGKAKSGKASSVLSDSALAWNNNHHHKDMIINNEKTTPESASEVQVEQPLPPPPPPLPPLNNEVVHVDDDDNKSDLSINTMSEAATTNIDINTNTKQAQVPVTDIPHHVTASPKPQFHKSPAPKFHKSPAPQFHQSPTPHEFQNSPKPKYLNSPAPHEFRNSPAPQFRNSPAPQFHNSPAVQQFWNSPAPKYLNSSAVQQFKNSPKPQFRNSPVVVPQFRNSPAVSKFHPAAGYGSSQRGTPLHPFGRLNGAFEYSTPRRSNMGNMVPPVLTESELGPSASEVAAAIARKPVFEEGENSTVGGWSLDESVEGLQSKLERWRTELPPVIDHGEASTFQTASTKTKSSRHTRRHTEPGSGLFSCFSNICGVECSIVCGGPKEKKKPARRRTPSVDNTSFL